MEAWFVVVVMFWLLFNATSGATELFGNYYFTKWEKRSLIARTIINTVLFFWAVFILAWM